MLFASIAALALAACGSSDTIRYKMIVEVDTPEGLKTGVAVREVRYTKPSSLPSIGESRPQWRIKGEAVAVDLPGGRTLFALLRSEAREDFGGREVWSILKQSDEDEVELWPSTPKTGRPQVFDPKPMLVHFKNIDEPDTVERVDPNAAGAALGTGYRLRRIIVSRTSESVTSGIN
jgi:hypothetical protein